MTVASNQFSMKKYLFALAAILLLAFAMTYLVFTGARAHILGTPVTGTVTKKTFESRYTGYRTSTYMDVYTYTIKPDTGGNDYTMELYYQGDFKEGEQINVRVYKGHTVPNGLDKDLLITGVIAIFSWVCVGLMLLRTPKQQAQNTNFVKGKSKAYKAVIYLLISIILAAVIFIMVLAIIGGWHNMSPPSITQNPLTLESPQSILLTLAKASF